MISGLFQLRVLARDQGQPQQTGTATVTVNLDRNTYNPVFTMRSYQTTIAETFTPSLPLLTVTATDADKPVSISQDQAISWL